MKRTLTLILACCICVCPVAGAGQPDMPKGAAVKFHFDNSVTDTDGNESLYLFNRKDCSEVTPVTEPDFDRATGGLRVNEYYAVDYDISKSKCISVVMRVRLGRIMDDDGPCAVVNSRNEYALRSPVFFVDARYDAVFWYNESKEKSRYEQWQLARLPEADDDGFHTYVATWDGDRVDLYVGDGHYTWTDVRRLKYSCDRLVLCPMRQAVVTDLALYGRRLSGTEIASLLGIDGVGPALNEGTLDKDSLEESKRTDLQFKGLNYAALILNVVIALGCIIFRRRSDDIAYYRFEGSVLALLVAGVSLVPVCILNGSNKPVFIAAVIVSLISYILVARRPVCRDEWEREQNELAAGAGKDGPDTRHVAGGLVKGVFSFLAGVVVWVFFKVFGSFFGATKLYEVYKDNLYVGTATGFDLMQFVSNILIFVFLVGFAVALAFFLSQIIAVLTLLLPLVALFRYNIFDGD